MKDFYPLVALIGSTVMVSGQLAAAWTRRWLGMTIWVIGALTGATAAGWAWWTASAAQSPDAMIRTTWVLVAALGIPVVWLIRYWPDEQQVPPWRRNSTAKAPR